MKKTILTLIAMALIGCSGIQNRLERSAILPAIPPPKRCTDAEMAAGISTNHCTPNPEQIQSNDAGGGGSVSPETPQTQTIPDSGDGNPASAELTPTTGIQYAIVQLTCSDSDGCDNSSGISETSMVDGQVVAYHNDSANAITFSNAAGNLLTIGALDVVLQEDEWLITVYDSGGSAWVAQNSMTVAQLLSSGKIIYMNGSGIITTLDVITDGSTPPGDDSSILTEDAIDALISAAVGAYSITLQTSDPTLSPGQVAAVDASAYNPCDIPTTTAAYDYLVMGVGSGNMIPLKTLDGTPIIMDSAPGTGSASTCVAVKNHVYYWDPNGGWAPDSEVSTSLNWAASRYNGSDYITERDDSGASYFAGDVQILSSGILAGHFGYHTITTAEGAHDGAGDAATLSDSGESFPTNAYIGMTLYNVTDGSSCTVTDNNGTTMTCTLAGGTDNDWDASDAWAVAPGPQQSGMFFYINAATTILHPAIAGYGACYYSDAANTVSIDPQSGSMAIYLDGASIGAGDELDSPGAAGDFICIHNRSTTQANTLGRSGTWIDGGSS